MRAEAEGEHPYATLAYARTLGHVGEPIFVEAWGTHVLKRRIDDRNFDLAGPYPLTFLADDAKVERGVDELAGTDTVSAVIVCDHLAGPSHEVLADAFDRSIPFKWHHLVDMRRGVYSPSAHHAEFIRRANRRGITVEWAALDAVLDDWVALYEELVERHDVSGAAAFGRASFVALARCPGLKVAVARYNGEVVGCHLWFSFRSMAWSHLASVNELGRQHSAAYALYDFSMRGFDGMIVNLGGGAGRSQDDDGLSKFKAGFANDRRLAYIYGAVVNATRYDELCASGRTGDVADFFPAYRRGSMPMTSRNPP